MDTTLVRTMSPSRLAGAAAGAALLLALAAPSAVFADSGKTTICHDTASGTNPYVAITVSDSSLPTGHTGDSTTTTSGPGAVPFYSSTDCSASTSGSTDGGSNVGSNTGGSSGGGSNSGVSNTGGSTIGGPTGGDSNTGGTGTGGANTGAPTAGGSVGGSVSGGSGMATSAKVLAVTSSRPSKFGGAVLGISTTQPNVPLPATDAATAALLGGSPQGQALGFAMTIFAAIGTLFLILFGPLLMRRAEADR